jgi:CRP-like cAMP-binding protein
VRLEKKVEGQDVSVEFMRLGVGDCFGELALLTGLPRSATAITNEVRILREHTHATVRSVSSVVYGLQECVLLELKRENFTLILQEYQNLRHRITAVVEEMLQETKRLSQEIHRFSPAVANKPAAAHLK